MGGTLLLPCRAREILGAASKEKLKQNKKITEKTILLIVSGALAAFHDPAAQTAKLTAISNVTYGTSFATISFSHRDLIFSRQCQIDHQT